MAGWAETKNSMLLLSHLLFSYHVGATHLVPMMNIYYDSYIIANMFLENERDVGGPGHRKGFLLFSGQKF